MRSGKGANLVEYIIPVALIGLIVGMGLYTVFSEGLLLKFIGSSGDIKIDESTGKAFLGSNIDNKSYLLNAPGSMGGTSDKPVKECKNGKCTIDFGDYILSGIPDNFSEFVEAQGNSGGTDQLAAIFDQLAEQILEEGDQAGYQEYLNMANLCHYLAKMQRNVEEAQTICSTDDDPRWCYSETFRNYRSGNLENDYSVPDNLTDTELFNLGLPANSFSSFFINGGTRIDLTRQKIANDQVSTDPPYRDLTTAIVSMYDNIMENPQYSDNLKNITTVLYKEIDKITFDQYKTSYDTAFMAIQGGGSSLTRYDPVTGEVTGVYPEERFDNGIGLGRTYVIHGPNALASEATDVDSALICIAGKNTDTGRECN
ncbi:MAG: hypothetical protein AB1782_04810 [Cyanobacteriota bacterium]